MNLHVRHSDRGGFVRDVDHVRGVGGDLPGMEVVRERVLGVGGVLLGMEVVGDRVRGVGGDLPGMEAVGDRVHGVGGDLPGTGVVRDRVREDLGEDPWRREVVDHGASKGRPHCLPLRKESRWAGPELRAPGLAVERGAHGGHELRVFHHGAGRAGKATGPKGCRWTRLFRCRGCHRKQGD